MLTARKPEISLTGETTEIIWSTIPEFAMIYNGISVAIPYVEHYLNNVINDVRTNYTAGNPELKNELDVFIRQEVNHSIYHNRFNKLMFDAGYDDLKPLIAQITRELKMLKEKHSLAFNAAYCAGFENTATFSAKYLFSQCDEFLDGANASGVNLLLWHVAEEFEHRTSCHRALKAVSGSYFTRMAGLAYSFWHINHCFNRATVVILKKYREQMTPEQKQASVKRERFFRRRMLLWLLPRMAPLLLPGFDPSKLPTPPKIQSALDFFHARGPIDESFNAAYLAGQAA